MEDIEELYEEDLGTSDSCTTPQSSREAMADDALLVTEQSVREDCGGAASQQNWWKAQFKSPEVERLWHSKVIEFLRRRKLIAVMFIGLFSLLWIVFFSVNVPLLPNEDGSQDCEEYYYQFAMHSVQYDWWYIVGGILVVVACVLVFLLTLSKYYSRVSLPVSIFLACLLMSCSFSLALALAFDKDVHGISAISFVAQFAITAVVMIIMYNLSRMFLPLTVVASFVYVVILEVLVLLFIYGKHPETYSTRVSALSVTVRFLFYICMIMVGSSTAYLSRIRLRSTFWKIAQCVLSQEELLLEKELAEKTILTMMPKQFAEELMDPQVQLMFMLRQPPFTIRSMDRVSILFADIVDFTHLSSTLSAAELVGIVHEVFSMCDELVMKHKCEKISTLGDCYFCVSGCPESVPSHASNCVDMGLAVVEALEDYRSMSGHPIEMRFGVHTGSVMCGVMGSKRFKFDVWSSDVTIANRIESIGSAGRVLISSTTKNYLPSSYVYEEANISQKPSELSEMPLYYIVGKRARATAQGSSVVEWKRKIQRIDTVHQYNESDRYTPAVSSSRAPFSLPCFPWFQGRRREGEEEEGEGGEGEGGEGREGEGGRVRGRRGSGRGMQASQSSGSIMDIFSRQSQLQHFSSYAELQAKRDPAADHRIAEILKQQEINFESYFDPKLKLITLSFHDGDLETVYHNYGRDLDDGSGGEMAELGLRITIHSYMFDCITLFFVFCIIMVGSATALYGDYGGPWYQSWLGVLLLGLSIELCVLVHILAVFRPAYFPRVFSVYAHKVMLNWFTRSLVALFFIYYPMTAVVINVSQCNVAQTAFNLSCGNTELGNLSHVQLSFFVTIVVLVGSTLFMDISYLVKLLAGFLSCVAMMATVGAIYLPQCISNLPSNVSVTTQILNDTVNRNISLQSYVIDYYARRVAPEAAILLGLILLLLAVVNRMSEVSARLSFLGRVKAAVQRRSTRRLKIQATWLLNNIIPNHVISELRRTGKFSRNHECVGVIFASIVNFSDLYHHVQQLVMRGGQEETYRVLNQIVNEFDSLLDRPQFQNIEKIKTIGSTYMAASGLGLSAREDNLKHVLELIDFALHLKELVRHINSQISGFSFIMHIGFNCGPVTSGVVGNRKMMYDIWGDTVNVASRMESTGRSNKVHMPESCLALLKDHITYESNREINVKGKGKMRTVFVTGRKQ